MADHLTQADDRVRFDWGPMGLRTLAPVVDVVIVVDVLSFTTCVDVALGRGAEVYPYKWHDGSEAAFAESIDAVVAGPRGGPQAYSLSPGSLAEIPPGTRLVLPSPNGSALLSGAADAGASTVVAACLRNGAAVGAWFADRDVSVAVIAAGERWKGTTGPMRVSVEDLWGAGCVLSLFPADDLSPEAAVAVAAWRTVESSLIDELERCVSGRELIRADHPTDVLLAGAAHVSELVPALVDGRFVDLAAGR